MSRTRHCSSGCSQAAPTLAAAVGTTVTLVWSNGQVEGQINRLKTIKRQMYGQANLDLLERRFPLAA